MRLVGLPWHAGGAGPPGAPDLGGVRSAHVGQLLCVRGTVLRTSAVQMLEILRTYVCKKCKKRCWVKCQCSVDSGSPLDHVLAVMVVFKGLFCGPHSFTVRADPESHVLPRPAVCPFARESGCKGKNFTELVC